MSYTALARRYRSHAFDEVVGQEPIARTLQSAIESGRVAHAYLFCGTRGVGKTSMARIFAKALAGGTPDADAAIMRGDDTDVIEIDAASNRGVEDARDVISNASYRPFRGRDKVYIIDEVHMLTREAFNALLKTMEEPPEHVRFILCTTEPHKVPATIQSRCQRFDFKNIPSTAIAGHLAEVVEREKLQADPDLLHAVARLGNGSMRDALSLMDRLMSTGEKHLTHALLQDLLGLPDRELIGRLIDSFADGDPASSLRAGGALLSKGISGELLLQALLERLRDLMVLAACGHDTDLVDMPDDARRAESARAERFDPSGLTHMIAVCESVQRALKSSPAPRALLDACVVRLAMTEKLADVAGLVAAGGGAAKKA